jgi:SAM-dependent methyltransferase
MSHYSICQICGGKEFTLLFECTDHLVSHRQFPVEKCRRCGFTITGNAPEPDVIGSYYESPDYISHTGGEKSISDILYGLARTFMLGTKARKVRRFTKLRTGSILDIGAGTGHFVKRLRSLGWQAEGVEVSDTARDYAINKNGVELLGSLSEGNFSPGRFDAVTLWHVLEHIHDTDELLMSISKHIKPGGTLLLALPNSLSADARFYREHWAAYDVPRHLWHFDSKSINSLVNRHDFAFVDSLRMPFDSFYISILSEKSRNCKYPFVIGMLRGLLFWLWSLLIKERSSSLLFVFRRN